MSNFEIIETDFGNILEIEERVSMFKMPKVMGDDFTALTEYAKNKNCEILIAPYSRYVDIDWEAQTNNSGLKNFLEMFTKKWHFFCGIPTKDSLENKDRIISKKSENRNYVKAIYHGPYQGVGKTYSEMYKWIKDQKLEALPESYEFYTNEPGKVKKSELETIIYIPLK